MTTNNRFSNADDIISFVLKIIMLLLIVPTIFCVIFIGRKIGYFEAMNINSLCSNAVLFAISLIAFTAFVILHRISSKLELTGKNGLICDGILLALFTIMYFVNCRISLETAFMVGWDVSVVQGAAYTVYHDEPLGNAYYFSIYKNNIAIVYILGHLLKIAKAWSYPFVEKIWIQVMCLMYSVAGFFSCMTVKKITKKLLPTIGCFAAFFVLVLCSAWKMVPYTDSFGVMFTILTVYFYLCYKSSKKIPIKIISIVLSMFFAMLGGLIKTSVYLVVIAFFIAEIVGLISKFRKQWKYFVLEVIVLLLLILGTRVATKGIINSIGLEYNAELSEGWQHYLMMGLNEQTTGGYNSDDAGMVLNYQTDRNARIAAEYQIIKERISEKGACGLMLFWLKKMVMTFNDGSFGWDNEVWIYANYADSIASNNIWTARFREIYWYGKYSEAYNTICQFVWIFVIIGIPGVCMKHRQLIDDSAIDKSEKDNAEIGNVEKETILFMIISFIGVFLYQMLFEARARYLFVFLPMIIAMAMIGVSNYAEFIVGRLEVLKTHFNFYRK